MKLSDIRERMILERIDKAEFDSAVEANDELVQAYDEIMLLKRVFDEKNWGLLIDKKGTLKKSDIRRIRRKFAIIIKNNPLIDENAAISGRTATDKMRLMFKKTAHSIDAIAMAGIAGALGFFAATSGPIIATLAGIGAAGSLLLGKKQIDIISGLNRVGKILDTIDAYSKLKPRYKPSRFEQIVNKMFRRNPEKLQKHVEKQIKKMSQEAQKKIIKSLDNMPAYIEYEEHGEKKQYPVLKLFDLSDYV